MTTSRILRTAALFGFVLGGTTWAAVDIEVRNGDRVTGTLSPADEVEVVRFRVPKDAAITVKAAAARKGPQVRLELKDPAGGLVASAEGKSASIARRTAAESGLYSVEITSKDGATVGDYSLAVAWKSRASFGGKLAVAGGVLDVPFSADADAVATMTVRKARKSDAVPALASVTYPDGLVEVVAGTTQKRTVRPSGACVLRVASPVDGDVTATVRVKPPRASNRRYALTTKAIGGVGGDAAFSAVVGPLGGTVVFPAVGSGLPGAQIDGSSVVVPAGALPVGTSIVISTAPEILDGTGTETAAGATVAFGPEGLRFDAVDKTAVATVTIPFDPAFGPVQDQVVIYTRSAKGVVTAAPKPYAFNVAAGTVSFATSHFSSFQAAAPGGAALGSFRTAADVGDPRDVCQAFDPDLQTTTPIVVYVAEGINRQVGAVRIQETGTFARETWAGGGAVTTLPANRLQFRFVDDVTSVYATPDGVVYASTSTRIFRIDPADDLVTLFAGAGGSGDSGDNGPPTSATFTFIKDVVVGVVGEAYVADAGANRIRQIVQQPTPTVLRYAGTGTQAFGQDGVLPENTTFLGLDEIAFAPQGGLYVADVGRVRHIDPFASAGFVNVTVAGQADGDVGSSGDGGPPTSASFRRVTGISQTFDAESPTDQIIVVTDSDDHVMRLVNFTKNTVTLLAGEHGNFGFSGDAGNLPGLLRAPHSVAAFGPTVFVADAGNSKVRVVFLTNP